MEIHSTVTSNLILRGFDVSMMEFIEHIRDLKFFDNRVDSVAEAFWDHVVIPGVVSSTAGTGGYDYDYNKKAGQIYFSTNELNGLTAVAIIVSEKVRVLNDQVRYFEFVFKTNKQPSLTNICHFTALPDEPSFVLLGRDPQAPDLLYAWSEERTVAEKLVDNKAADAGVTAHRMRQFKKDYPQIGMSSSLPLDDEATIGFKARRLIKAANRSGHVVRIDVVSDAQAPAMGKYEMVADIRARRVAEPEE